MKQFNNTYINHYEFSLPSYRGSEDCINDLCPSQFKENKSQQIGDRCS